MTDPTFVTRRCTKCHRFTPITGGTMLHGRRFVCRSCRNTEKEQQHEPR